MAYTQPILDGTTLPHPTKYTESSGFRGTMVEMANGTVHFDNVQSTPKRVFKLGWTLLTDAERAVVEGKLTAMAINTVQFVAASGLGTFYVTRTDSGIEFVAVKTSQGLFWSSNGDLELREV